MSSSPDPKPRRKYSRESAAARVVRPRIGPGDWDALRASFHRSMLSETPLVSLAPNVDGCHWPETHATETPSDYLDLPHALALELLTERGHTPDRLDALADILRGTLSFDESFGAMVEVAGKAESAADPVRRNLDKLSIQPDFPLTLCALSPTTLAFCHGEKIHTLGELLDFARGATRRVFVGGEFKALLNAVYQQDEVVLARYLPYRPKHGGLHLIEGLAHLLRGLPLERRMEIARLPATCDPELRERAIELARYFDAEVADMVVRRAEGYSLDRYLVVLDDLSLEAAVSGLFSQILPAPVSTTTAQAEPKTSSPAGGRWSEWWRRMFGRGDHQA